MFRKKLLHLGVCLTLVLLAIQGPLLAAPKGFPLEDRTNIVLLGDSITADGKYGQLMMEAIDKRYPGHGINILARGSHGDTARGALSRLDVDVVAWRPDWVLVNFGVNDLGQFTVPAFLQHYEMLLNRLSRDTSAQIAVMSPIYPDKAEESPKMAEMVQGMAQLAKRYKLLYIPVYETCKSLKTALPPGIKYAPDGSHPNLIGYEIFTQTILKAMNFPMAREARTLQVPSRRVTVGQVDTAAGQTFTLRLPQPVQFQITLDPPLQTTTPAAAKTIVLDGKLAEWDRSNPILLQGNEQLVRGVLSAGRDKFSARAYTAYDQEAWYFAIEVEDSVVRNTPNPTHVVDRDCVELCLDLRPPAERAAKPYLAYSKATGIGQLILAPATREVPTATIHMGTGDGKLTEGSTLASTITQTGYQLELRIPKTHFPGGELVAGANYGLDIAVVNVDRNHRYLESVSLRWSGSGLSAFNNREFGDATLGQPAP